MTVVTRLSLHAIAELLLAGPQYDASGTIRLRVVPGGFVTIGEVAQDVGVTPRPLGDVQKDHTDLGPDDVLTVETVAATRIAEALRIGAAALAAYAPSSDAVLWPEHFDIGITVDEVNYGVSPGDGYIDAPYAYVGPWNRDGLDDPFWNAPSGPRPPSASSATRPP